MRRPLGVRGLRILALNWRCPRHPQAGGSEANLFEQARRWAADGNAVTVFCADPGRKHAPERDEVVDGVRVIRRGGRFTVYLFAALFVLLNARRYDRVLDVANGIPFFAPVFTRKPVVLLVHHVHGPQWYAEFSYPLAAVGWFLERWIVPRLYRREPVIAVSPTTRDALANTGIALSQIKVVYNGSARAREPKATTYSGEQRIAYVGRIRRYKRLDRLVRMIPTLREGFPDIRLDIAGSGEAAPAIDAVVGRLGLRDHVVMHGFVNEEKKAEILSRAAVFATPSMHEGWGLTVIEANRHSCPAVAYDVPGLRAAIRHGETGLLAQDDADFRGALSLFLGDRDTRRRYSEAAQAWSETFSWDSCARQTLAILLAAGFAGATIREKTAPKPAPQ
jgi:glycosyltransferase involved in cell wall biosynthesis